MITSQRQVLGILIAAVAAEWARKGTLYPLDTLTTCMQYSRQPVLIEPPASEKRAAPPPLLSQIDQVRHIVRRRGGPLSLYNGISTQLVGVVPTSLVYMPVYEVVSSGLRSVEAAHLGAGVLPASQLASIATGIASSCVRVPISVVKVTHPRRPALRACAPHVARKPHPPTYSAHYPTHFTEVLSTRPPPHLITPTPAPPPAVAARAPQARLQLGQSPNAAHAISAALDDSGWRGLYAGWGATCTLDVLYALVQFTSLEWLRSAGAAVVRR
jgi:hypothetical protein